MSSQGVVDKLWEISEMKKWWEKIKEHPIFSKVAAQLIGWAIIGIIGLIFSAIYFQSILNFAIQKYVIPMWGLMAVGIVPTALAVGIIFFIRLFKDKPETQKIDIADIKIEPDWRNDYVGDIIFDILWQWSYDDNGVIDSRKLIPICPFCKRELSSQPSSWLSFGFTL